MRLGAAGRFLIVRAAHSTVEVLTIQEAAAILRISRNAAYAAARKWRATGGKVGIPCIEIGRTVRVPRADLDKLLGRTNGSDAA